MYVKVCHVHFLEDIHVRQRVLTFKGMYGGDKIGSYVRTYARTGICQPLLYVCLMSLNSRAVTKWDSPIWKKVSPTI